jgi:hypothetical protein
MPCETQFLKAGTVEQRGGQHVHGVEPAAGLADVLDDEVAREVRLRTAGSAVEPVPVLERVVHLGVRHRAGVEPDIQHVLDPAHGRLAGRVIGIGPGQLVDVGPVQVGRPHPEVAFQLVQAAVHIGARVGRVVGHPDRDRGCPQYGFGRSTVARAASHFCRNPDRP